jgi:hypothetical protein
MKTIGIILIAICLTSCSDQKTIEELIPEVPKAPQITYPTEGDAVIRDSRFSYRTKRPVTRSEALDFGPSWLSSLPSSASNICFNFWRGGYLKFSGPTNQCIEFANHLITKDPRESSSWTGPLTVKFRPSVDKQAPSWWMNLRILKRGLKFQYDYSKGGPSVHKTIWIDLDDGVVYYVNLD